MITFPTKLPTADEITNFVKWPIEKKENAIRTAIPLITFVASKMFIGLSSFFSLTLATEVCVGAEIIYRKMNPEKPTPAKKATSGRFKRTKQDPKKTALKDISWGSTDPSKKTDLKRIKRHCIPLGKLLSSQTYCDREGFFEIDIALTSFRKFNITKKTITDAWEKYPNEKNYKSRLDYLNTQANIKFQENFKNLEKVFGALVHKSEREVLSSINNGLL